ncbi:MAG: SnoaL-like polyketide cyclase [Acidimicrobiales bacterium]|nr:SnoaL-like polyketide cyclase [Acidimicrobiales bacterium]
MVEPLPSCDSDRDIVDSGEIALLDQETNPASIETAEARIGVVQRLYDSTVDRDLAADAYADDFIWHAPQGRGALMGVHVGRDYIEKAFEYVLSIATEFSSVINEIIADDQHVISFNRDSGVRGSDGKHFGFDVAIRWRVENGQIQEMWEYIQDEEHKADFF